MALASMQDAFAADEEENRIRYNQWRRLDEEERKSTHFIIEMIMKNDPCIQHDCQFSATCITTD